MVVVGWGSGVSTADLHAIIAADGLVGGAAALALRLCTQLGGGSFCRAALAERPRPPREPAPPGWIEALASGDEARQTAELVLLIQVKHAAHCLRELPMHSSPTDGLPHRTLHDMVVHSWPVRLIL